MSVHLLSPYGSTQKHSIFSRQLIFLKQLHPPQFSNIYRETYVTQQLAVCERKLPHFKSRAMAATMKGAQLCLVFCMIKSCDYGYHDAFHFLDCCHLTSVSLTCCSPFASSFELNRSQVHIDEVKKRALALVRSGVELGSDYVIAAEVVRSDEKGQSGL
jgi:hypothetical protein